MTATLCKHEVDGERCDRTAFARGWCKGHWGRWKRNGDPGAVEFRKFRGATASCTVDGCPDPHAARGFCDTHYARWKKLGHPDCERPIARQRDHRRITEHEVALVADWSLSTEEVAETVGVHRVTVAKWRRYIAFHTFRRSDWTDDDVDFVTEQINRMKTVDIAERLGKGADEVQAEINRLRSHGFVPKRTTEKLDPWCVSGRPLIAKTCPDCGHFLSAEWFPAKKDKRGRQSYWHNCKKCRVENKRTADEDSRDKWRASNRSYMARMQAITLEQAENRGKEWTTKDLEVLEDPNKTVLAKALELKRTYAGTMTALVKNGLTSKPEPIGNPDDSAWRLFWDITDMAVAS